MPSYPGTRPLRRTLAASVLSSSLLTSCSPAPAPASLIPRPLAATTPAAPAPRNPPYRKALTRSLHRYLDDLPGQLSVSVRELSTGLSYTYNHRLRTATASIVKVDLVVALLLRAQRRHRGRTGWERRSAARAIKVSDNAAASALWSAIGGAPGLAAAHRTLGLRDTTPGPGGAWGAPRPAPPTRSAS
ncbi:hypothetical protein [Nonomuraea angiospora]